MRRAYTRALVRALEALERRRAMVDKVLFSSEKMDWATPWEVFNPLKEEFGITLDVCATSENTKCRTFFAPQDNALKHSWYDRLSFTNPIHAAWMNPPYGRQLKHWIAKAKEESLNGLTVVCLIPARTDTAYWHDYIWDESSHSPRYGVEVRLLRGRIKFVGAKDSAPFPSAVVIFHGKKDV